MYYELILKFNDNFTCSTCASVRDNEVIEIQKHLKSFIRCSSLKEICNILMIIKLWVVSCPCNYLYKMKTNVTYIILHLNAIYAFVPVLSTILQYHLFLMHLLLLQYVLHRVFDSSPGHYIFLWKEY